MSKPVNIELLKQFLRLPSDFIDEDVYLLLCIESATTVCSSQNQTDYRNIDEVSEDKQAAVRIAILKLAGFYYDNRDESKDNIPDAIKSGVLSLLNSVRDNFNFGGSK